MMHLPFDLPDRVGALDYPDLAWYANDWTALFYAVVKEPHEKPFLNPLSLLIQT